jgi:hypothetical protein
VRVASVEHIGKEVIVDPTDAGEDSTAEMLSATEVLIYENATEARRVARKDTSDRHQDNRARLRSQSIPDSGDRQRRDDTARVNDR